MYKQKIKGSSGPLIPNILFVVNTFIVLTLLDFVNRTGNKSIVLFFICIIYYILTQWLIHRYSHYQFEYFWFDKEMIVKRRKHGKVISSVSVDTKNIVKFSQCNIICLKKGNNYCATIFSRLFNYYYIEYKTETGETRSFIFEPDSKFLELMYNK